MVVELERRILTLIDEMVEHGSDDELFAGGYLCGHVTLAVAQLQTQQNELQEVNLYQVVNAKLQQAIEQGELSPPDQVLVRAMWQKLYQQAQQE